MKASELRSKSKDELREELVSLKKEQFNLRFQAASGQLENTARVRQIRRDVARIQTILGEQAGRKELINAKAYSARCSGKQQG